VRVVEVELPLALVLETRLPPAPSFGSGLNCFGSGFELVFVPVCGTLGVAEVVFSLAGQTLLVMSRAAARLSCLAKDPAYPALREEVAVVYSSRY
jgi:hypothetical protein